MVWLLSCSGHNGSGATGANEVPVSANDSVNQAFISFNGVVHDFGTIIEGEMVVCYFDYMNSGVGDLVIRTVETTCGCATPDWSEAPLGPGKKNQLKVIFDATGRYGVQRKVITVWSNAINQEVKLTIKAEVKSNV